MIAAVLFAALFGAGGMLHLEGAMLATGEKSRGWLLAADLGVSASGFAMMCAAFLALQP